MSVANTNFSLITMYVAMCLASQETRLELKEDSISNGGSTDPWPGLRALSSLFPLLSLFFSSFFPPFFVPFSSSFRGNARYLIRNPVRWIFQRACWNLEKSSSSFQPDPRYRFDVLSNIWTTVLHVVSFEYCLVSHLLRVLFRFGILLRDASPARVIRLVLILALPRATMVTEHRVLAVYKGW